VKEKTKAVTRARVLLLAFLVIVATCFALYTVAAHHLARYASRPRVVPCGYTLFIRV